MIQTALNIIYFNFFALFLVLIPRGFSQSIVDELEERPAIQKGLDEFTFAEKIIVTSRSKRIFILTNKNQSLEPGDFATILINGERVVRGLIAKSREGKSAFKVLKTYDSKMKARLKNGMTVKLYRGDENQLTQVTGNNLEIRSEKDLFSNDLLIEMEDKPKTTSTLTSKNILQMGFGVFDGIDKSGDANYYSHFVVSWNYKVKEFVWFESLLGYTAAKRFPAEDISTDIYNLTFRAKYCYELPFYSYVMPYLGLQVVIANSPEAGENSPNPEDELALVDDAERIVPTIGITYLKRFVPSWFLMANLGLDVINIGLGIEF